MVDLLSLPSDAGAQAHTAMLDFLLIWVLGIKLRSSQLHSKCSDPLNYLPSPATLFFEAGSVTELGGHPFISTGQQAPGMLLPLSLQCWDYKQVCYCTKVYVGPEDQTQVVLRVQ